MRPSLRLLSKINQLSLDQRYDIAALLQVFTPRPSFSPPPVSRLPFLFSKEYVECWATAAGGETDQLRRFLSGADDAEIFPRCVLVSLCRDSLLSIFAALWLEYAGWEQSVRTPVSETFYMLQGTLELTLEQSQSRICLRQEGIHQIEAGTSYQMRVAGGSRMIVLQSGLDIAERKH
jgi:hypothetical protein